MLSGVTVGADVSTEKLPAGLLEPVLLSLSLMEMTAVWAPSRRPDTEQLTLPAVAVQDCPLPLSMLTSAVAVLTPLEGAASE